MVTESFVFSCSWQRLSLETKHKDKACCDKSHEFLRKFPGGSGDACSDRGHLLYMLVSCVQWRVYDRSNHNREDLEICSLDGSSQGRDVVALRALRYQIALVR